MSTGTLTAAVLLPPLGVHLAGRDDRTFWTSAGLTLLGWLPGAVYALWVVRTGRTVA